MAVSGTYTLDGLLQGPNPGDEAVEHWVQQAAKSGLDFSLELDGGQFSLLASNAEKKSSRLVGGDLQSVMTAALEAFSALYGGSPAPLYSTLRSREMRGGAEIQTLYFIQPDGKVSVQSRKIGTEAPPPPPGAAAAKPRRHLLLQSCGLLVLLTLLGIVSLFLVDWKELFHRTKMIVQPSQGVELVSTATADYVSVSIKSVKQMDGYVELEIKRGPRWAEARALDLNEPIPHGGTAIPWRDFLALQAVKRGYMYCCFYDERGVYTGESMIPLDQLNTQESFLGQTAIPRTRAMLKKLVVKP
ncbi:hypothetical protein [Verrucomicrobium sp. BvORR106]|uniref:hypothetical protein n=1 Tax=Verrucomicrobium sp. BvORR106 TaxID=1403819 RepID=UPI000570B441|nr:hypothetical protein [Verrucomicrobium sp. BvORR106]